MIFHEFYKPIEHESNLAKLFNMVFEELATLRQISSPSYQTYTLYNRYSKEGSAPAIMFYEILLLEVYLHSIIAYLPEWKEKAMRYNSEFSGSWKYYALAEHIDGIKEYGGEESDYSDGSIRSNFTDEELKGSSIKEQLTGYNHILLTTCQGHVLPILHILKQRSQFNVFKMFETCFGKKLKTFREDKNGYMIENTWVDEAIQTAKEQVVSDDIADMLSSVVLNLQFMIADINKLRFNRDNKAFFAKLPGKIDNLLNLEIEMYPLGELPEQGGAL